MLRAIRLHPQRASVLRPPVHSKVTTALEYFSLDFIIPIGYLMANWSLENCSYCMYLFIVPLPIRIQVP